MSAPVTPVSSAAHAVYAVAGGNHVTIELDRAVTGGCVDVIEVLAQPGGGPPPHSQAPARFQVVGQPGAMTGYFAEAGVRVADPSTEPATTPPGPGKLREIAARWGITFWTGPVSTS
jgi:hypothetical protein